MLIGCLGGRCQSREMCAHYLQGQATQDIRLCAPDEEEPELIKEYEDKPPCGEQYENTLPDA